SLPSVSVSASAVAGPALSSTARSSAGSNGGASRAAAAAAATGLGPGASNSSPPIPMRPAKKAPVNSGSPPAQSSNAAETAAAPNATSVPARPPPSADSPAKGAALANALPDLHALVRRQVETLAGAHVEGGVPRIEIAHDRGTLLGGRVRIGEQPLQQVRLAIFAPPHLRPAEIEALVPGEAVK